MKPGEIQAQGEMTVPGDIVDGQGQHLFFRAVFDLKDDGTVTAVPEIVVDDPAVIVGPQPLGHAALLNIPGTGDSEAADFIRVFHVQENQDCALAGSGLAPGTPGPQSQQITVGGAPR